MSNFRSEEIQSVRRAKWDARRDGFTINGDEYGFVPPDVASGRGSPQLMRKGADGHLELCSEDWQEGRGVRYEVSYALLTRGQIIATFAPRLGPLEIAPAASGGASAEVVHLPVSNPFDLVVLDSIRAEANEAGVWHGTKSGLSRSLRCSPLDLGESLARLSRGGRLTLKSRPGRGTTFILR